MNQGKLEVVKQEMVFKDTWASHLWDESLLTKPRFYLYHQIRDHVKQLLMISGWDVTLQILEFCRAHGFIETLDFPGGSEVKASACNVGDLGSIPGWGSSPGEGNGNPLQYSCLENPMDRGAWQATVHGVAKSWTRLSDFTFC